MANKAPTKRGGVASHMYDREMLIKNTATEFSLNHKDMLASIRKNEFHCPMGWIRAQLGFNMSQLVTSEVSQ